MRGSRRQLGQFWYPETLVLPSPPHLPPTSLGEITLNIKKRGTRGWNLEIGETYPFPIFGVSFMAHGSAKRFCDDGVSKTGGRLKLVRGLVFIEMQ